MNIHRKTKIILIVVIVLLLGGASVMIAQWRTVATPDELSARFITANLLDLSQIAGFSKYRSCAGHDYRNPVASTGVKESSPRSMKHYVMVRDDLRGENGVVKALAPFDGKISVIDDDGGGIGDQQIWLTPDSISPRQWHFVFFHIDLADGLKKGSKVVVGQAIGTANLSRGPDSATGNFDIAVKYTRPFRVPALDAPFAHMAQNVLAEYAKYGLTEKDLAISEAERDAKPCPIVPGGEGPDVYFPDSWSPNDIVWLGK